MYVTLFFPVYLYNFFLQNINKIGNSSTYSKPMPVTMFQMINIIVDISYYVGEGLCIFAKRAKIDWGCS